MSRPVDPDPPSHRLSEDMRRLVVDMVERRGLTRAEAARALGVSHHTITNTLDHFLSTGGVETSHGGGRQRVYDEEQRERLRQLISRRAGLTSAGLVRAMGTSAPHISERTMRRYRAELGLTPRRQRISAAPDPEHDRLRREWAWEHRRAEVCNWLHSDESTVCMRDTGDVVWIPRGEPTPRLPVKQLRCSVNIWGVVWGRQKIFVRFQGHLTSQAFISILEAHLLPEKENIAGRPLLLDGLPAHRTSEVRDWLTQHSISYIYLPPHSPQFNAIEECWAWIKHWVRGCAPNSAQRLEEDVDAACDALPEDVISANLQHAQDTIRELAYKDETP